MANQAWHKIVASLKSQSNKVKEKLCVASVQNGSLVLRLIIFVPSENVEPDRPCYLGSNSPKLSVWGFREAAKLACALSEDEGGSEVMRFLANSSPDARAERLMY